MEYLTRALSGHCPRHCPQGNRCCLEGGIAHEYHICGHAQCACHSRARYDAERGRLTAPPAHEMERTHELP